MPANSSGKDKKDKTRRLGRKNLRKTMPATNQPDIPLDTAISTEQFWRALDLVMELAQNKDLNEMLANILDAAIELVRAERGFIVLRKDQAFHGIQYAKGKDKRLSLDDEFVVHIARNFDKRAIRDTRKQVSYSIIETTIREGTTQALGAVSMHPLFATKKSVKTQNLQAVVCCPLHIEGEVCGAVYLDNRTLARSFTTDEVRLVNVFSAQAGLALTNAKQLQSLAEKSATLEQLSAELSKHNERKQEIITEQMTHIEILDRELIKVRDQMNVFQRFNTIKGQSDSLRSALSMLGRLSDNDETVLIQGETGTGKELFARAVHFGSKRRNHRFVAINTPEISKELLESELFGHLKGSWTGAFHQRDGLFVSADKGTIFLDEITEMPMDLQSKLLRVLQEKEVRPIGSNTAIPIDCRVVAASNRDLLEYVKAGQFREDLYYRLNILPLVIPPLRDREGDVPMLIEHFLSEIALRKGWDKPKRLTRDAMNMLDAYTWPGNIRQLKNEIERACVIGGEVLRVSDFPTIAEDSNEAFLIRDAASRPKGSSDSTQSLYFDHEPENSDDPIANERQVIVKALYECRGNVREAADALELHHSTLYRKLLFHGIKAKSFKRRLQRIKKK